MKKLNFYLNKPTEMIIIGFNSDYGFKGILISDIPDNNELSKLKYIIDDNWNIDAFKPIRINEVMEASNIKEEIKFIFTSLCT